MNLRALRSLKSTSEVLIAGKFKDVIISGKRSGEDKCSFLGRSWLCFAQRHL